MGSGGESACQFDISEEEKDKLVGEMVRYVLFKTHQNSGCPIKREELTQLITKNYRQSQLPTDIYKKYVEDTNTSHLTGFTFAIIAIVHLAGGKIAEENLWPHMRQLGLHETEENHPVFGNVKQKLETLVQQRYLQKEKVHGPEGNSLFYELAERALDETVRVNVKEYISQIVQKEVPPEEND